MNVNTKKKKKKEEEEGEEERKKKQHLWMLQMVASGEQTEGS